MQRKRVYLGEASDIGSVGGRKRETSFIEVIKPLFMEAIG